MIGKWLCRMGLHKYQRYASQIFCLNKFNLGAPLEFATREFFKCKRCEKSKGEWRDNPRFWDQEPVPYEKPEYYEESK